jgi:hypothetical protein
LAAAKAAATFYGNCRIGIFFRVIKGNENAEFEPTVCNQTSSQTRRSLGTHLEKPFE